MASKGNKADSIGVKVFPDTRGFAADLLKFIKRIEKTTQLSLKVNIDESAVAGQARTAAKAAQREADKTPFSASAADAVRESQKAREDLARSDEQAAKERLRAEEKITKEREKANRADPINSAYRAKILADIKALAAAGSDIPVGADGDHMRESLRAALVEATAAVNAEIPVGAEGTAFRSRIQDLLDEARAQTASVEVDADTILAAGRIRAFTSRIRTVRARLTVDTSGAAAQIGTALAALSGARLASDMIQGIGRSLSNLDRNLPKIAGIATGIGGISAASLAAVSNVTSLVASLGAVAGVAGLLPGIVGSLATVGATLATAFHGVGSALSAVNKTKTPAPAGADPRIEAMQVEDAQRAISDAEESAADATEAAAERIADAKRSLQGVLASVADAHVQSVQAAENAEKSLQRANRDVLDAQKASNAARREAVNDLRDLDSQLKNATLSGREAEAHYKNAVDAYNQALTDPSKSNTAIAALRLEMDKAAQSVEDQKNKVADLTRDKAKAARADKTGSEAVLAAQRNVSDAQDAALVALDRKKQADADVVRQNLAGQRRIQDAQRAVKAATADARDTRVQGLEAVKRAERSLEMVMLRQAAVSGAAASAAQTAMDHLTPSARTAVITLLAVKDRLGEVRRIAQENFFAGFSAPLRELADVVIPQLKTGIGSVATSMGKGVQTLFRSLSQSLGGGVLDGMLQNLALTLTNLNVSIAPIIASITTLGSVGMEFLPGLGAAFSDVMLQFNDFIQGAAADGSLRAWIQDGIDAVKDLASILGSTFRILGGIASAADAAGGSTLSTLADGLKGVADIVNREPFQSTLRTIFEGAHLAMDGLSQAIGPIGEMFVTLAPTLKTALGTIGEILGTALGGIAGAMSDPAMQTGITGLFDGILAAVQAIAPSLPAIAQALGAVMGVVGTLVATVGPLLAQLLTGLAPVVVTLVQALAPLIQSLGPLLTAAITLAMPILEFIVAHIAGLIPVLTSVVQFVTGLLSGDWKMAWEGIKGIFTGIWKHMKNYIFKLIPDLINGILAPFTDFRVNFRDVFEQSGKNVREFVGGLGEWFEKIPKRIRNAVGGLGKFFSGMWDGASRSTGKFIDGFLQFFRDLPGRLASIFENLARWIMGAGRRVMSAFGDGIKNAIGGIGEAVGGAMEWVKGFFPHSPAKRGPLSGSMWNEIRSAGQAIGGSFADGIDDSQDLLSRASDGMMRAVTVPAVENYKPGQSGSGAPLSGTSITNNINEAISARATAIEVTRLQTAGV